MYKTIGDLPVGAKFNYEGYPLANDRRIVVSKHETWSYVDNMKLSHETEQRSDRPIIPSSVELPHLVMPTL